MKQYLDLLKTIKEKGTIKPASRAGMPGTTSLFGYQYRHNLQEGFPLLTTKKVYWKGVAVELLWMIQGNTNVKYLIDNNVNIWNEDAYNYYIKRFNYEKTRLGENFAYTNPASFEDFLENIKNNKECHSIPNYTFGDCGYQYGKVWRDWECFNDYKYPEGHILGTVKVKKSLDQIKNVIEGLKNNPEGRRHIVTALDPANYDNLALFVCHSMFQFNCRPLTYEQRFNYFFTHYATFNHPHYDNDTDIHGLLEEFNVPKYYLDCQLYQRSCDVFLGGSMNLASYSLLTHIMCEICNMMPGDFIHSFGDAHIYDDHIIAVDEQLSRLHKELPILSFSNNFKDLVMKYNSNEITLNSFFNSLTYEDFIIENYNPDPTIKATLSTGLIK